MGANEGSPKELVPAAGRNLVEQLVGVADVVIRELQYSGEQPSEEMVKVMGFS